MLSHVCITSELLPRICLLQPRSCTVPIHAQLESGNLNAEQVERDYKRTMATALAMQCWVADAAATCNDSDFKLSNFRHAEFKRKQFPCWMSGSYGNCFKISWSDITYMRPVPDEVISLDAASKYWLSDDIITSYLRIVLAKTYTDNLFYDCKMFNKLSENFNYLRVAGPKNIFTAYMKQLFVIRAAARGAHWMLIVVDNVKRHIEWYDSMKCQYNQNDSIKRILSYLMAMWEHYNDTSPPLKDMLPPNQWPLLDGSEYATPKQQEYPMVNSGMFAIQNARCIVQDGSLSETSYNNSLDGMNALRRNTLHEILHGKAFPSLYHH